MTTTRQLVARPQVGQKARVIWANSLRRGETGTVTEVTPRGIVTLRMEDGTIGSWSRQHLTWDAVTRDQAVALIAEAEALQPFTNGDARRSLQMAKEALGRYDARPSHWTAEMAQIALRDAGNSARLAVKYA